MNLQDDYEKKKFRGYLAGVMVVELDRFGMTINDIEIMFSNYTGPIKINTRVGKVLVDKLVWPNGDIWDSI